MLETCSAGSGIARASASCLRAGCSLVELEVRDLLSGHGYPGEEVPVVRVSALRALAGDPFWMDRLRDLLDAVDRAIPLPERLLDRPFLIPVESVLTITGRGTVVTGKVEQGTIRLGQPVEVVGLGPTITPRSRPASMC